MVPSVEETTPVPWLELSPSWTRIATVPAETFWATAVQSTFCREATGWIGGWSDTAVALVVGCSCSAVRASYVRTPPSVTPLESTMPAVTIAVTPSQPGPRRAGCGVSDAVRMAVVLAG